MRRRARNAPTAEVAEGDEQSFQGEAPPTPLHRRRGRPRVVAAQEQEQYPWVEQEAPELDPIAFVASMIGINQGLAALNQAIPVVQQMLQ